MGCANIAFTALSRHVYSTRCADRPCSHHRYSPMRPRLSSAPPSPSRGPCAAAASATRTHPRVPGPPGRPSVQRSRGRVSLGRVTWEGGTGLPCRLPCRLPSLPPQLPPPQCGVSEGPTEAAHAARRQLQRRLQRAAAGAGRALPRLEAPPRPPRRGGACSQAEARERRLS